MAKNDSDSIADMEDSIEMEETESDFSEADESTDTESSRSGSNYSE